MLDESSAATKHKSPVKDNDRQTTTDKVKNRKSVFQSARGSMLCRHIERKMMAKRTSGVVVVSSHGSLG